MLDELNWKSSNCSKCATVIIVCKTDKFPYVREKLLCCYFENWSFQHKHKINTGFSYTCRILLPRDSVWVTNLVSKWVYSQKFLVSKSILTRWYLKIGTKYFIAILFLDAVTVCNKGIKFHLSVEVYLCPWCANRNHHALFTDIVPKVGTSNSIFFFICTERTRFISLVSPSADQAIELRTLCIPWFTRDEAYF